MRGPQKPLVAFGIGRLVATSSLMSMPHGKQRGLERCHVMLNCLLHNGDSMQSVRLAAIEATRLRLILLVQLSKRLTPWCHIPLNGS